MVIVKIIEATNNSNISPTSPKNGCPPKVPIKTFVKKITSRVIVRYIYFLIQNYHTIMASISAM